MDVELKHEWTVTPRAWYIRFPMWVWETRQENYTFCQFFWSWVLMWVGIPLKFCALLSRLVRPRQIPQPSGGSSRMIVVVSGGHVGRQTKFRVRNWTGYTDWDFGDGRSGPGADVAHRYEEAGTYVVRAQLDPGRRRIVISREVTIRPLPLAWRVLEGASGGASATILAFATATSAATRATERPRQVLRPVAKASADGVRYAVPVLRRAIRRNVIVVVGTLVLALAALGFWEIGSGVVVGVTALYHVAAAHSVVLWLLVVGAATLGFALYFGLIVALAHLFWSLTLPAIRLPYTGARRSLSGFREAFVIGYKAVKSNTCPRIVFVEDEEGS